MSSTFQTVIALAIVAICAALLLYRCTQWFKGTDAKGCSSGSGCQQCPSQPAEEDDSVGNNVVPLESLHPSFKN